MGWQETGAYLIRGIVLSNGRGELHESLQGSPVDGDTFEVEERVFVPAQGFSEPYPSILEDSAAWKAWMEEAKPYNLIGLLKFGDGDSGLSDMALYVKRSMSSWHLYDEHQPVKAEAISEPTGEEMLALVKCCDAIGFTGDRTVGLYVVATC